jgi:hypothetical protein
MSSSSSCARRERERESERARERESERERGERGERERIERCRAAECARALTTGAIARGAERERETAGARTGKSADIQAQAVRGEAAGWVRSGLARGAASGAAPRGGPDDEQMGRARRRASDRARNLKVHAQARRVRWAPGAAKLETGADWQPRGCERRSATQRRQPRGHEGVRRGNHSGRQPRAKHVGQGCAPGGEGRIF